MADPTGTFRPDFLVIADPFVSIEQAQVAVDAYVVEYNTNRPHQALSTELPVMPADRFQPVPQGERDLVELWLPPQMAASSAPTTAPTTTSAAERTSHVEASRSVVDGIDSNGLLPVRQTWTGGPIEFDRVVPPSGNLAVARRQFWLGPQRGGQVLRFWADVDLIHLLVAGARIKTVRSDLSVNDLAQAGRLRRDQRRPLPYPRSAASHGRPMCTRRFGRVTDLLGVGSSRQMWWWGSGSPSFGRHRNQRALSAHARPRGRARSRLSGASFDTLTLDRRLLGGSATAEGDHAPSE